MKKNFFLGLFFFCSLQALLADEQDSSKIALHNGLSYSIFINPFPMVDLEPAIEMGVGINYKAFSLNLSSAYGNPSVLSKIYISKDFSNYSFKSFKAEIRYMPQYPRYFDFFVSLDYFYWAKTKTLSYGSFSDGTDVYYFDKGILHAYRNVIDLNLVTKYNLGKHFYGELFAGLGYGRQYNRFSNLENLRHPDIADVIISLIFWPLFLFDKYSEKFQGAKKMKNMNLGMHIGYTF